MEEAGRKTRKDVQDKEPSELTVGDMQYLIRHHGEEGLHPDQLARAKELGARGVRTVFSETDTLHAILPTRMERDRLHAAADEFLAMPSVHFPAEESTGLN